MAFSSSRTFPGQEWAASASIASVEKPVTSRWFSVGVEMEEMGSEQRDVVDAVP